MVAALMVRSLVRTSGGTSISLCRSRMGRISGGNGARRLPAGKSRIAQIRPIHLKLRRRSDVHGRYVGDGPPACACYLSHAGYGLRRTSYNLSAPEVGREVGLCPAYWRAGIGLQALEPQLGVREV